MPMIDELKAVYASLSQQLHYGPSLAPLWDKMVACIEDLSARVTALEPAPVAALEPAPAPEPVAVAEAVAVQPEPELEPAPVDAASDLHL